MGNVVVQICGGQPVPQAQKRITLAHTSFAMKRPTPFEQTCAPNFAPPGQPTNPKTQLKSIVQGVLDDNSDDPLMEFPWKGMAPQNGDICGYGMFDDNTNMYNNFVFYQSAAAAEAAAENAAAAFKRMEAVMNGAPKRVLMDALVIQCSKFSLFEKRTLCPAAMSLSIMPLKEDIHKEQFLGVCSGFQWAELQKELLFMGLIFGYFEEDGQAYGLASAVYPTVELANLVTSRGWFKRLLSGEMGGGRPSFTDMINAPPNRAVGEAFVVKA